MANRPNEFQVWIVEWFAIHLRFYSQNLISFLHLNILRLSAEKSWVFWRNPVQISENYILFKHSKNPNGTKYQWKAKKTKKIAANQNFNAPYVIHLKPCKRAGMMFMKRRVGELKCFIEYLISICCFAVKMFHSRSMFADVLKVLSMQNK